jgi:hypothetical protein
MTTVLSRARLEPGRATFSALLALGLLAGLAPACGKKGPPLAPTVRLPAAVDQFSARRFGATVYVRFAVPAKNQDNSVPADIARVEVYGYTGNPASDDDMVKHGTLVATVPVRRPPPPEEEDREEGKQPPAKPQEPKKPTKSKKPVEPDPGFDQGAIVTVTEMVTPALAEPVVVAARARAKTPPAAASSQAPMLLPAASLADVPARVYVAVGVSRRGHRGAFSRHAAVPVVDVPAAPGSLKLSHSETAIALEWTPPPDAPAVAPPPADGALLPAKRPPLLAVPAWSYEVFAVPAAKPAPAFSTAPPGLPPQVPLVELPVALNQGPLTATTFSDTRIEFGTERCYVVRTVKAFGPLQEESEPSPAACITPRDIYPPAAPRGLTAVVNAGVVSLIWEPNTERDLDGYFVLRAEAPGATLQPLTRDAIHDTTFNDKTVKPGVRYVYAVVAVDKAGNASEPSNRVEDTAR